ncbi:hypothetical protein RBI22_17835 [Alcaligenaceae bacterium C4P045]|nr:hypothetical protein [Alcaligenaceae bacterium C4P045]
MQPSRRAFLSGRKPAPSAWASFCRRLGGACDGVFTASGDNDGVGRARFAPAGHGDMAVAVSLAREYGVVLALTAPEGAVTAPPDDRPAVYVDPVRLDRLTPVFAVVQDSRDSQSHAAGPGVQAMPASPVAWDAQPGCPLGVLADAGLTQFEGAPRHRTLAHWLAAPHPELAPGGSDDTGIVAVEVLLADGTFEALGPFGADATQPLQSATVQALVPALFQAASSPDGQACRAHRHWPLAYRLDALLPQAPHTVNLGQALLGHGGTLAWVCRVRLIAMPMRHGATASDARTRLDTEEAEEGSSSDGTLSIASGDSITSSGDSITSGGDSITTSGDSIGDDDAAARDAARRLTRRIKDAFDPGDLFPMLA